MDRQRREKGLPAGEIQKFHGGARTWAGTWRKHKALTGKNRETWPEGLVGANVQGQTGESQARRAWQPAQQRDREMGGQDTETVDTPLQWVQAGFTDTRNAECYVYVCVHVRVCFYIMVTRKWCGQAPAKTKKKHPRVWWGRAVGLGGRHRSHSKQERLPWGQVEYPLGVCSGKGVGPALGSVGWLVLSFVVFVWGFCLCLFLFLYLKNF